MFKHKLTAIAVLGAFITLFALGCGSDTKADNTAVQLSEGAKQHKVIKYRRLPTATSDMFEAGIVPLLKKKGYELQPVEITDSVQRELALSEDEIDMHIDSHSAYVKTINRDQKTDLYPALPIPTVPAGIYAGAKNDLKQIADGDKIAFPNDASNEARSLQLLKEVGLIKMKEGVDPTKYKLEDVAENPHNLNFVLMKGPNIAGVRSDVAFIILRGSDAYNAKIDFNSALAGERQEDILAPNMMCFVVNGKHKDEPWVKDVIAAYKSPEFKEFMKTQSKFWILPDYLRDK